MRRSAAATTSLAWFVVIGGAFGCLVPLHSNATQMLTGGIDVRTTAGRLGHSGGRSITLKVNAYRTRPADRLTLPLPKGACRDVVPA